jgi:hypothetical protein
MRRGRRKKRNSCFLPLLLLLLLLLLLSFFLALRNFACVMHNLSITMCVRSSSSFSSSSSSSTVLRLPLRPRPRPPQCRERRKCFVAGCHFGRRLRANQCCQVKVLFSDWPSKWQLAHVNLGSAQGKFQPNKCFCQLCLSACLSVSGGGGGRRVRISRPSDLDILTSL